MVRYIKSHCDGHLCITITRPVTAGEEIDLENPGDVRVAWSIVQSHPSCEDES